MTTPIVDFLEKYKNKKPERYHMPGHKGKNYLGFEEYDITEISGADSLFSPSGIIKESELNASSIFSAHTFYSCEGSSLSIRAMLYLALLWAKENNRSNKILAGRNAHKTFLTACGLLDIDVSWIYSNDSTYLSCNVTSEILEKAILKEKELPCAVYITSPDYLGNITDICALAQICRKYNILLLADNAHGAYLKFLNNHPLDFGADMVCDSAHKTLPVLTGGGYLHISKNAPKIFLENAKDAMSIFASTSPSYLILQSLDKANELLPRFRERLIYFAPFIGFIKEKLTEHGYTLYGNEPLKITIKTKLFGYSGKEFNKILEQKNIYCEFYDSDFCVLMLPVSKDALMNLAEKLFEIKKREPIIDTMSALGVPEKAMSIKEAMFALSEKVKTEDALNRILASPCVSCPPAVPIIACGEVITEDAISAFKYYGIDELKVVKR